MVIGGITDEELPVCVIGGTDEELTVCVMGGTDEDFSVVVIMVVSCTSQVGPLYPAAQWQLNVKFPFVQLPPL